MKDVLEGSTRSRLILVACFALASLLALALMITYKEKSIAAGPKGSLSVAGVTAITAEYQGVTLDSNGVIAVAAGYLGQDEAADETVALASETEIDETKSEGVQVIFPVTPEMVDPSIPLEERPNIRLLAGLVEAEIGQVVEEEAAGMTFDSREEEIEAHKEGIAVVLSVFNRCAFDSNYPDDIEDNIHKRNQFAPPKYPYTVQSLRSVELAIELWNEGRAAEILPPEFESFFGWGKHNYYYDYDNNYAIYEGLIPLRDGIKDAQRQIIPELH